MFHGSCRKISKILSFSLEPISKSDVHYLARFVSSKVIVASKPRYRGCIAVEEAKICIDKPIVIVDKSPWYRWALDRLGLKYQYQRFSLRNTVERFFRYLKERTRRFYNNINSWKIQSIEDYASTIAIIRNLFKVIKTQAGILLD